MKDSEPQIITTHKGPNLLLIIIFIILLIATTTVSAMAINKLITNPKKPPPITATPVPETKSYKNLYASPDYLYILTTSSLSPNYSITKLNRYTFQKFNPLPSQIPNSTPPDTLSFDTFSEKLTIKATPQVDLSNPRIIDPAIYNKEDSIIVLTGAGFASYSLDDNIQTVIPTANYLKSDLKPILLLSQDGYAVLAEIGTTLDIKIYNNNFQLLNQFQTEEVNINNSAVLIEENIYFLKDNVILNLSTKGLKVSEFPL